MSTNDTRTQDDYGEQSRELTVLEAAGDCEVTESDDVWEGPFPEYTKYGTLTGCSYVRCRDCGIEQLTGRKDFATHRDGCRFGEDSDENNEDDRDAPRRSEPADFGGGETTGVQDL